MSASHGAIGVLCGFGIGYALTNEEALNESLVQFGIGGVLIGTQFFANVEFFKDIDALYDKLEQIGYRGMLGGFLLAISNFLTGGGGGGD